MNKRFNIILGSIIIIFILLTVVSIKDKNNGYIRDINYSIEEKNITKLKKQIKGKDLNQVHKGIYCEHEVEGPCYSPLQTACMLNDYKIVKLLVENGADVNYMDTIGDAKQTPLIHTIDTTYNNIKIETQLQIVKYLLKNGADKNIKDSRGNIALDYTEKLLSHYDYDKKEYIENKNITLKEKQIKQEIISLLS